MRRSLFVLILATSAPLPAVTFVVDTGADNTLSACTAAPDDCTLRGALLAANAAAGADTIEFAIAPTDPSFQASSGHWLLQVGASALPAIEQPVVIDGYTQPGASANTLSPEQGGLNTQLKIEIRGSAPNAQSGLEISGNFFAQGASVLRGLAINRFAIQIGLTGSGAHRVEGCFLGTDISGSAAAQTGNGGLGTGVRLYAQGPYVIGGSSADVRNLISGMSSAISSFASVDGLVVQGNLIGTNAAGNAAIGSVGNALEFSGPVTNTLIGGSTPAARNVIAASRFAALYLSTGAGNNVYTGSRVLGNYFGTDVSGRLALGNGLNPASPSQPQSTINMFRGGDCPLQIGGLAPGEANLIAFGGAAGIQIATCERAAIRGNVYLANRGVAVDLSVSSNPDGASANDAGDPDSGGNRLQNFPTYSVPGGFLPAGGASAQITATVDSALANASYPLTLDVYRATCGGGSGQWLGSATIDAVDAQLPKTFTINAPDGGNMLPLVLQATDALGNSSEFSATQGDAISAGDFEDTPAPLRAGRCP